MANKLKINEGFTLVELLIAVSLFIIVATISMGAIISVFDANKKSQSSKTVVDNLNLSIENMVRVVRFGGNYHCGTSGNLNTPRNCSNGDTFLATSFNGDVISYGLCGAEIRRGTGGEKNCNQMPAITSPDTFIEYLKFYVFGAEDSGINQPYIIAVIKGRVGAKPTTQTAFSIETLISQRALDL
ncbi:MAG: type II secretion system protein [Patescibacteria group bacterium]